MDGYSSMVTGRGSVVDGYRWVDGWLRVVFVERLLVLFILVPGIQFCPVLFCFSLF